VADSIDPAAKLKTGDARDNKLGTVIGQVPVTFPIGKQNFLGEILDCGIPNLLLGQEVLSVRSNREYAFIEAVIRQSENSTYLFEKTAETAVLLKTSLNTVPTKMQSNSAYLNEGASDITKKF
jgi:hypothetical protein